MFELHQRARRQLVESNIGSNKKVVKPSFQAQGNNNNLYVWTDEADLDVKSDGLKTSNTMLKDGSGLIGAPSRFLNNILEHWIISLVFITIILVLLLLICCIIRYYCCGKRKPLPKVKDCKYPLLSCTNQTDGR